MDYNSLITGLTTTLVIPPTDANFQIILPFIITDAEQRIYREFDFLATRDTETSTFAVGSRTLAVPDTSMNIIQGLSVITPSTALTPATGTRIPLELVSLDVLDAIWPQQSLTDVPQYYAMMDNAMAVVGPTPDEAYVAEFTGTFRPQPMSASNTTTYLGDTYPDLYLSACMVFACAYQKDFSASAPADPQMAVTWEGHYQTQKTSVMDEVQRQKSQGPNWTPYSATPLSTPRG